MRLRQWFHILPLRLRALFRRSRVESELDEEMQYHLDQLIERRRAEGLSMKDARREVAIRAAIGAGRPRLLRQFLTESVLLSVAGAAFGLLLARGLTAFFASRAAMLVPRGDIDTSGEIQLNFWVFLFTAGVALAAGLLTGLAPAWRISRTDLTNDLKESGRSHTASKSERRLRHSLVVAEVAVSFLLLVSAGLLLRSFAALRSASVGVRADHVLTAGVNLPEMDQFPASERLSRYRNLVGQLRALPGVLSAGLVTCLPAEGYCGDISFQIEGRPLPPGQIDFALERAATPEYFAAAGIPLLRGRAFREDDGDCTRPVIVSASMASRFWPAGDALGKRISFGDATSERWEVVGIVGDVLIRLDENPAPTLYIPLGTERWTEAAIVLHTASDPMSLAAGVRAAVGHISRDYPIYEVRTMEEVLNDPAAERQFAMLLLGLFALLALVLAAVGLYGVLSYSVAQSSGEIGIRMALGAAPAAVRASVIRQGLRPTLVGVVIGLAGSFATARFLRALLFGVTPADTLTYLCVPVVLLAVALAACYVPAPRATRIDPLTSLRAE